MEYKNEYDSPLGKMILTSDWEYLTGLYSFEYFNDFKENYIFKDLEILNETKMWLDIYFECERPDFTPKLKLTNLIEFTILVLRIVKDIPYGEVVTYKSIAEKSLKLRA